MEDSILELIEDKITAYMSHAIRGRKGDYCPVDEIQENTQRAIKVGVGLQMYLNRMGIPIEIYIPGVHDEFVMHTYQDNLLTTKQILDIDCKILDKRDLLLVYTFDGWLGGGVGKEMKYAKEHSIPTYVFDDHTLPKHIRNIIRMCYDVLDRKEEDNEERFNRKSEDFNDETGGRNKTPY